MDAIKKRLVREGIDVTVFNEEKVDLPTFLALTREDLIDMNFSIVKTRKIIMLQDEIKSKNTIKVKRIIPATSTATLTTTIEKQSNQTTNNRSNNINNQTTTTTLTDIVNDTIITPVTTIDNGGGSYSIVTIPATTIGNHQIVETTTNDNNDDEINNAVINIDTNSNNSNNNNNNDGGDGIMHLTVSNHDYASISNKYNNNNILQPASQHYSQLFKPLSESMKTLENLDFRSLLLQDEQGSILIELLERGDFLSKRLPANFVKVIALTADEFIYQNFGMKYPFDVGELMVEKIYESIGHQCNLGEKKEWFGLRKGNNRTGRLHSRNERRKRLNRDLNTSLNMASYIRYRNTRTNKKSET